MLIKGCEPFALKLRYLIGLHGSSPTQLERDSKGAISKSTVYSWTTGLRSPNIDQLTKLANSLGFTCAEILFLLGRADIETTEEELARAMSRSTKDVRRATYRLHIHNI